MRVKKKVHELATLGRHCILDAYGCNPLYLDDETFVKEAIKKAVTCSGATLLQLIAHKFQPQGVTALALLSESHISLHTWPELNYVAVDVFTCGNHTDPDAACALLKKEFEAESSIIKVFDRATNQISL
jgi:S-adenosylmethionine decarboxylase